MRLGRSREASQATLKNWTRCESHERPLKGTDQLCPAKDALVHLNSGEKKITFASAKGGLSEGFWEYKESKEKLTEHPSLANS